MISKQEIVTKEVAGTLDRLGLSNRSAFIILSIVSNALGHSLNDLKLSPSTIINSRRKYREMIVTDIRENFQPDTFLTVHWDGKRMEDLTTSTSTNTITNLDIERLAIVVSGGGNSKLLAIPKLENGTGLRQAEAVFESLNDWNVFDKVNGMCFDTTASNTGIENGAAFLLAKKFSKPIMFFACRHHIAELLLGKAFEKTIEPSTRGPVITIFDRFQKQWNNIDKSSYLSGMQDPYVKEYFPDIINTEMVAFLKQQLEIHQARGDYIDFLEQGLLFFGESISRQVKKPGATSRARWMAKATYSLKIYLFRNQFTLTSNIFINLRH